MIVIAINYELIGKRIKTYRLNSNKTQEDLSEYLSVSVGYVSQIERGVTKINLDLLSKISTYLNTTIELFISGVTYENKDYLNNEIIDATNDLKSNEKQILLDIIKSMIKNR